LTNTRADSEERPGGAPTVAWDFWGVKRNKPRERGGKVLRERGPWPGGVERKDSGGGGGGAAKYGKGEKSPAGKCRGGGASGKVKPEREIGCRFNNMGSFLSWMKGGEGLVGQETMYLKESRNLNYWGGTKAS